MRFAFVHAEKAHHSISALCRVLGVARQGYHQYATRGPSRRHTADEELQADVASRRRSSGPRRVSLRCAPRWMRCAHTIGALRDRERRAPISVTGPRLRLTSPRAGASMSRTPPAATQVGRPERSKAELSGRAILEVSGPDQYNAVAPEMERAPSAIGRSKCVANASIASTRFEGAPCSKSIAWRSSSVSSRP